MKVDVALRLADALKRAAEQAIAEGRDELLTSDLGLFAQFDDSAREELEAAINAASR